MDYKIEHKESQRFLALIRHFLNESHKDDNNRSIPDFWDECYKKYLIESLKMLRVEGKRDLYGLCSV